MTTIKGLGPGLGFQVIDEQGAVLEVCCTLYGARAAADEREAGMYTAEELDAQRAEDEEGAREAYREAMEEEEEMEAELAEELASGMGNSSW